jgi:hypothetical protein
VHYLRKSKRRIAEINQIAELFNIEIYTINYHIKNIYKQKELMQNPTTRKIRIVQKEGNREV